MTNNQAAYLEGYKAALNNGALVANCGIFIAYADACEAKKVRASEEAARAFCKGFSAADDIRIADYEARGLVA